MIYYRTRTPIDSEESFHGFKVKTKLSRHGITDMVLMSM